MLPLVLNWIFLMPSAVMQSDDAWDLLSNQYDADEDGRITAEEYPRGPAAFARLDQDKDGAITSTDISSLGASADQDRGGGRFRPMPAAEQSILDQAQALLRLIPPDPETEGADRDHWQDSFALFDTDEDGLIGPWEMRDRMLSLGGGQPADRAATMGAFQSTDGNRDRSLDRQEWLFLFDKTAGETGILSLKEQDAVSREEESPAPQAQEGRPAPDFSLQPPQGGKTISLSDFQGKKPVALIFGSYT